MEYVIGIDGGGTKTEAVAYDLNGEAITSAVTGFGNLLNGEEEALNNIINAIKQVVETYGIEGLKGLYLGLAGAEVDDNAKIVQERIKKELCIDSTVMNDGELALKALLKGEDGVLTIAGTGSVAFGIKNGKEARCGGWGNLLGDEGSAYKIAIEAFKNMIYENDFGIEMSELSKEILESLKMKKVDEIIGFVYSNTKDEVASITPIVSKRADLGDKIAIDILKSEGLAIAKTTERVYKKLGFQSASIGIVGGVLKKSKILRETFEEYLNKNANIIAFVDEEVSPAKGAYYLYIKEK
ncbi:N-acetylglucosamine kinase [Clostridium paridis]|uniref:ATPase n=1 Tax=Clostridium paridis TaxID=2803863 RepID=A0A937K4J4_9CLOT|nr:BadF/BadG/BcrA/BcrD ATPase family protein [Clostridium paridis]MBL4932727.1 ATPase [Clostridium paridis]